MEQPNLGHTAWAGKEYIEMFVMNFHYEVWTPSFTLKFNELVRK
jgi:hypothetical protein